MESILSPEAASFLYVLLPGYLKRSMKRKNIGLKILFYIPLVFIGYLITHLPVDFEW
jgi:hypothetical protein